MNFLKLIKLHNPLKEPKRIKKRVEFCWGSNKKIWTVYGSDMMEINKRCRQLRKKYGATDYKVKN